MKNLIEKIVVVSLMFSPLVADVNLEKGIYDAAEEMMRFDDKLNRLIAEHNQVDLDEDIISINDFEETQNGYKLTEVMDNNNSKVEVLLENRKLTIMITTIEKTVINNESQGEEGYEMRKSELRSSLFLPEDADENSMQKEYQNGVLKIQFLKQKN